MPEEKEVEFDHKRFFEQFTMMIDERVSLASSYTKSAYTVVKEFVESYNPDQLNE